jgi:hypothetical protein
VLTFLYSTLSVSGTAAVDITKLVPLLFIADREVQAKVESCFEIAHESPNVDQLKAIFDELLACYNACYIKKKWDCWAVVKNNSFYYLFDPIGIEVPLKKVKLHRATLYRFDCLKTLLSEFLKISSELSSSSSSSIEIGGIMMTLKSEEQPKKKKKLQKLWKKLTPCKTPPKSTPIMVLPDPPEACVPVTREPEACPPMPACISEILDCQYFENYPDTCE